MTLGAFNALGIRPALGRGIEPGDILPSAGPLMLLGPDLCREAFGADSAVMGRTVRIDDEDRLGVGVALPGFRSHPARGPMRSRP